MKHEIRPSLLDRLISAEDGRDNEWGYSVHQIKTALLRDLATLLNTRSRVLSPPEGFSHSQSSILNYGLPDLGGFNLAGDRGKAELVQLLENTLRQFEPRFKSLRVQFIDTDAVSGLVHFRIEALMHADPVPEVVAFDTLLDTGEKTVNLQETRI